MLTDATADCDALIVTGLPLLVEGRLYNVAAVLGGSLGGARALEWAIGFPDRLRSALVLAISARSTAYLIGVQTAQIQAAWFGVFKKMSWVPLRLTAKS